MNCEICKKRKTRMKLVLVKGKLCCDKCSPSEIMKLFNDMKSRDAQRMVKRVKK